MKLRYRQPVVKPDAKLAISPAILTNDTSEHPLLRLTKVCKQFPGTQALDSVNLDVRAGEVHALFGENGAGKTTIIQIIAGVIRPSSGEIFLNDEEVIIGSVQHARELGISAVFQEFSLIPQLTVEESLFIRFGSIVWSFLKKKICINGPAEHWIVWAFH